MPMFKWAYGGARYWACEGVGYIHPEWNPRGYDQYVAVTWVMPGDGGSSKAFRDVKDAKHFLEKKALSKSFQRRLHAVFVDRKLDAILDRAMRTMEKTP